MTQPGFRITLGVVAHRASSKVKNIMSPEMGFVVYDILFWSFIALLAVIVRRDRFTRRISEPGTRVDRTPPLH